MSTQKPNRDRSLKENILDALRKISKADPDARIEDIDGSDDLSDIAKGINSLAENIPSTYEVREEVEQNIMGILDGVMSFAALDFSKRIEVAVENSMLEAVAVGLNMLGEELESTTVSKNYMDSILQSMKEMLIILDTKGTITKVNRTTTESLVYEEHELVGQSMDVFLVNEVASLPYRQNSETQLHDTEGTFLSKDGRRIPVILSRSSFSDDEGNLQGTICIARDITGKKEAEEQLDSAQKEMIKNAHNAGMADIATGTLHNVKNIITSVQTTANYVYRLLGSSKVAGYRKANAVLRNNIDRISDFVSNDPKADPLMKYYLHFEDAIVKEQETVKENVKRLLELTENITKVISAQQSYAGSCSMNEYYDLAKIVDDAITMQMGTIRSYEIKIEKEISDIQQVRVQKTKLVHIIVNLLKNARDALLDNPEDRRNVRISIESDDDSAYIKIGDNGLGIAPDNLSQIFNHGFTTKRDGHGFGLHSSASYMAEMGGKMSVESEGLGKGTTFILTFPIDPE